MHEMNFTRVQTFTKFADVYNWEFSMLTDAYYHSRVHSRKIFLNGWESLLLSKYDRSIFTANTCIRGVRFNKEVQEVVQEHWCWPHLKGLWGKGSYIYIYINCFAYSNCTKYDIIFDLLLNLVPWALHFKNAYFIIRSILNRLFMKTIILYMNIHI